MVELDNAALLPSLHWDLPRDPLCLLASCPSLCPPVCPSVPLSSHLAATHPGPCGSGSGAAAVNKVTRHPDPHAAYGQSHRDASAAL